MTEPPHVQVIRMATGLWVSRLVYMAAALSLGDRFAGGPRAVGEVAAAVDADPRSFHRLCRALASVGVLHDAGDGRFALTPLGEALRSDAPGAARSTVLAMAGQWAWRAWEHFPHAVATGEPGMIKAFGMNAFEYLGTQPEDASHFSAAMVGIHAPEPPAVAAAYDFSRFGTIVDVGGATGNMLAAVLSAHPGPRGVLYDLPHVVRDAPALLAAHGIADRVAIESGSFFERVPAGGDAYILSHVIHDWSEADCERILRSCRRAMPDDAALLLVEFVLPEGDEPHFGKLLDMVMLAIPGGEERTQREYETLLARAGFRLVRIVPTSAGVSVIEAVKE